MTSLRLALLALVVPGLSACDAASFGGGSGRDEMPVTSRADTAQSDPARGDTDRDKTRDGSPRAASDASQRQKGKGGAGADQDSGGQDDDRDLLAASAMGSAANGKGEGPELDDAEQKAQPLLLSGAGIATCADDITGNNGGSGIAALTDDLDDDGFKTRWGAGGVNMSLTSYPVVKIYRAPLDGSPPELVLDDPELGRKIKEQLATNQISVPVTGLSPGSKHLALCASELKDRCVMKIDWERARQLEDDENYDVTWQAFIEQNNADTNFGFIGGTREPFVVSGSKQLAATQLNVVHLWSRNDGFIPLCLGRAISPIVVDLGGRGLGMTSAERGVSFPIKGDARRSYQVAWPAADGAYLLAMDRDGNGAIDHGGELFGEYTATSAGRARDGFAALAALDANGDGLIDARDPAFSQLVLWRDADHDGRSTPAELSPLAARGVQALSVAAAQGPGRDVHGNDARLIASVRMADGTTRVATDVWFALGATAVDQSALSRPALPGRQGVTSRWGGARRVGGEGG